MKHKRLNRRTFMTASIGAIASALILKNLPFTTTTNEFEGLAKNSGHTKTWEEWIAQKVTGLTPGTLMTIHGGPRANADKSRYTNALGKYYVERQEGELILTETIHLSEIAQALKTRTAGTVWIIETNEVHEDDYCKNGEAVKLLGFAKEQSIAIVLTIVDNSKGKNVNAIRIEDGTGRIRLKPA